MSYRDYEEQIADQACSPFFLSFFELPILTLRISRSPPTRHWTFCLEVERINSTTEQTDKTSQRSSQTEDIDTSPHHSVCHDLAL